MFLVTYRACLSNYIMHSHKVKDSLASLEYLWLY